MPLFPCLQEKNGSAVSNGVCGAGGAGGEDNGRDGGGKLRRDEARGSGVVRVKEGGHLIIGRENMDREEVAASHGLQGVRDAVVGQNHDYHGDNVAVDRIPVAQVVHSRVHEGSMVDRAPLMETHRLSRDDVIDANHAFERIEILPGGGDLSEGAVEDMIPVDPLLAETHYSQYDDFESDESEEDKVGGCGCGLNEGKGHLKL
jgi:hypothetical protein